MTIELKPEERLDDLQRNGFKIIQNPGKFCFGMECAALWFSAKVKPGEKVLDLGDGNRHHSDSSGRKNEGWSSHGPGDPGGERGYGKAKRAL